MFAGNVDAKKKTQDTLTSYSITGNGTGTQGSYLVEITVNTKDNDINDSELAKAAVHGVLFRGFSNEKTHNFQKPLAGSPTNETEHLDFYNEFFGTNGSAATFANVVKGTRAIMKSGKEYKITATVQVQKDALLKYLQNAGVIRSLNSAF